MADTKGKRAEREAAQLLTELLGHKAERMLGEGRLNDEGDIKGIPDTTVQVANRENLALVLRVKTKASEQQQENAKTAFGVTMLRMPMARWLFVLTPKQYSEMWKAAQAGLSGNNTQPCPHMICLVCGTDQTADSLGGDA